MNNGECSTNNYKYIYRIVAYSILFDSTYTRILHQHFTNQL